MEDVDCQFREDTSTKVQEIKREDFPDSIWKVCEKLLEEVFPKDLHKGVSPRQMEHEFKIDVEPDTALIHWPI